MVQPCGALQRATSSGLWQSQSAMLGSAPACSSRRTASVRPFWVANHSAVRLGWRMETGHTEAAGAASVEWWQGHAAPSCWMQAEAGPDRLRHLSHFDTYPLKVT